MSENLGWKTLLLLVLKRAWGVVIILLSIAAIYLGEPWSQFAPQIAGAGLIITAAGAFVGYLEYSHYRVTIGEDRFEAAKGIVTEEEIGVPYRRIREAKIERGIMEEMLGLSTLTLTIAGEEDNAERSIVLPLLDKNLADKLQNTILDRAQVEVEVRENNKQSEI